jgi:hypothetical protein
MSTVPLHPTEERERNLLAARQFVDFLNARFEESFEESEAPRKTYVAFHLAGVTVVAAREMTGELLEEFVEAELGGTINRTRAA